MRHTMILLVFLLNGLVVSFVPTAGWEDCAKHRWVMNRILEKQTAVCFWPLAHEPLRPGEPLPLAGERT